MKDRIYIDGNPVWEPSKEFVRQAVKDGKVVVVVDEANMPLQITPEMLSAIKPSEKP